ncbi:type II toxin-antitoxin system PemK/MazF family toxin [Bradyrhizobium diazoefficiens]|nr:type II toxin-antitoxin system PemK/MazF family toxin [Bradyrhizobium diazoefficiens]MBR0778544.1 type II toxin-antitoxin system PemK/MazF family toxin [Bradyrhizobium diazoefficiens]
MPLAYYPSPGEIVLCNYGTGFISPEMTKLRPAVVVSPRLRRRADLVAVVPLSTTPPNSTEAHHCCITLAVPLPKPFEEPENWVKCDMVATVALSRLDRFRDGREPGGGARKFRTGKVSAAQLVEIRKAILHGLGLGSLTIHL